MPSPEQITAFVGEGVEPSEPGRFSALFRVSIQGDSGEHDSLDEPTSLDEALLWAGQRCDMVVVTIGGSDQRFTAGSDPVPGMKELPDMSSLSARPIGTSFDGAEQVRQWLFEVLLRGGSRESYAVLADLLSEDVAVSCVEPASAYSRPISSLVKRIYHVTVGVEAGGIVEATDELRRAVSLATGGVSKAAGVGIDLVGFYSVD